MDTIRLHDKTFRRSISCEQLQKAIAEVAARINSDYREKRTPLFVGVLNGSFMFMGELLRHISFDCEVSFVKIASYSGTATTGRVRELIGLSQDIRGRHVILVEDIVDTGASIEYMTGVLKKQGPAAFQTGMLPETNAAEVLRAVYSGQVHRWFRARLRPTGTQLQRHL